MEEKTAPTGTESTHQHGCFVCNTAIPLLQHCWSDATKEHFRSSRLEFLKGIRSLLDDRIAHLSHTESKGTHVTVE